MRELYLDQRLYRANPFLHRQATREVWFFYFNMDTKYHNRLLHYFQGFKFFFLPYQLAGNMIVKDSILEQDGLFISVLNR
jgi:hypothetical protein